MLLKSIARIFVKHAGNVVGFGVAGSAVIDLWDLWNQQTPEPQDKLAEVKRLAEQSARDTRELAQQIAREVAGDLPGAVRDAVAAYLTQVPAMVRRSMKRPADPSGRTVPPGTRLMRPEDLLGFLPAKPARFRGGDYPLPGVDWELVELLGVGGFGEVWKARNPLLAGVPPVALKFCTDADAARTLQHEAAVLNQVMVQGRHPGIVQLQHSYLRADPPCLEYELVEGGDLTGLIHDWHRSPDGASVQVVNEVMLQLAEILGFAHRLSPPIVHRDLKPANVLVQAGADGSPRLKVADFGIGGVAAGRAIREAAAKPAQYVTAMAAGTCTPLYASPQQAAGGPPDPRDDVFALGVIWLQMLTGDLSVGRPGGAAWRKYLLARGLPSPAVELLESCFEDAPEHRPGDAQVMAERLKALVAMGGAGGPAGGGGKNPGVIAAIIEYLTAASAAEPITKDALADKLAARFPGRGRDKMMSTINTQMSGRLQREKGLKIEKNAQGGYWAVPDATNKGSTPVPPPPSTEQYRKALGEMRDSLPESHLRLLRAHYQAPQHTATGTELAQAVGFKSWRAVNLQYGALAERLGAALGYQGDGQSAAALVKFVPPGEAGNTEWLWVMHAEMASALEALGWV